MKYHDSFEDRTEKQEYKKRPKRSSNIPGVGMRIINQQVLDDFDDEYSENTKQQHNYPFKRKQK